MRPITVAGTKYLSQQFSKQYTIRHSAIEHWLYFLKINHPDYCDIKIYSDQLTSLPENGSILNQLPFINKSDSDSSNLITSPSPRPWAVLTPIGYPAPAVGLGNNIQDNEFNNNVLDTLVPNLVPNLSELELLGRKV